MLYGACGDDPLPEVTAEAFTAGDYNDCGVTFHNLGQRECAMADYDRAIQLDPNFAEAYFNTGVLFANTVRLQETLPLFEKSYALGLQKAAAVIQQIRQELGLLPVQMQDNPIDPQAAFEAFQRAASFDTLRQTVQQFPILAQMIPMIEQVIQQQLPPLLKLRPEQRLLWLRQTVEERK